MSVAIVRNGSETVLRFSGALYNALSISEHEQVKSVAKPGARLVLDLSEVREISAGGIRELLQFWRYARTVCASASGTGISDDLRALAQAVGFAELFTEKEPAHFRAPLNRSTVDAYPTHVREGFPLRAGTPLPFGATLAANGINFSIFSRHASRCSLLLYLTGSNTPLAEIPFLEEFRIGDVFCMLVFDLEFERLEYAFRVWGPEGPGLCFDPDALLLDPMARAVSGGEQWAAGGDAATRRTYRGRFLPADFDWEGDLPLRRPLEETVIYELHVRGFTRHPSAAVRYPGTFAAVREKIPYLKGLGINCVELMPIFEFDEQHNPRTNPYTGEALCNYWGYDTVAFFAPKASYAAAGAAGMQADEFKALIKELHRNDIEVILDVVFNHTAEGDERGPTISFRGLDNSTYYMLTPDGRYVNFSGCGNTMNCNHPVVRTFVVDCLRYWVAEFHVDGFRFDLASILSRDEHGVPLANPPLLEALAADPILAETKLIAEAWDAGGLYQVGSFPGYGRWAEWNGRFRDSVRKFLKGDGEQATEVVQRLVGSPDLYRERAASASVNFITCHDGFTLADLVSFNEKHNEANGENNRDGADSNYSWNCGMEGDTDDPGILSLRRRQTKNALAILLLSRGIPMLLMGDECGRTQQGNNNAYCHDSALSWFDWGLVTENAELLRFCRELIRLRKERRLFSGLDEPLHRSGNHGPSAIVTWHGVSPDQPDWSAESRSLAFMYSSEDRQEHTYVALNMYWEQLMFRLPSFPEGISWRRILDTARPTPNDITPEGEIIRFSGAAAVSVHERSVVLLSATATATAASALPA